MRSEARVVVTNPTGLHARPAVKLAQLAAGFDANIEVRAGDDGEWVRARSTARVMKLKAGPQSTIHFRAEGSEANDALSALVDFVRRDFDEGPAAVAGSQAIGRLDEAPCDDPNMPGADPAGTPDDDQDTVVVSSGTRGRDNGTGDGFSDVGIDSVDVPETRTAAETEHRSDEGRTSRAVRRTREWTAAADAREHLDAEPSPVRLASTDTADAPGERTGTAGEAAEAGRAIQAVAASPGLAIGILHAPDRSGTREGVRQPGSPSAERAAFDAAVTRTIERLRELAGASGGLARDVIGFQISLLQDEEFLGPVRAEIDAGTAADRAWLDYLAGEIADYESAPTAYLRDRAADLRDLRERVALAFAGDVHPDPDPMPEQCVLVVDELTPSRFLELDRSRVVAVATHSGSVASHAAMLARAHGMPMLVQLACESEDVVPGMEAVVDADDGRLVLTPSPAIRERYSLRIKERRAREREAAKHASRPARTRGGARIQVLVNVDDPAGLAGVDPSHCDGIGLVRTEFLFRGAAALPGEEAQLDCYRRLAAWAKGRPVTVRTLDAGGDKPIPGLTVEDESNPFLGLRGVRLSLAHPEVFATQLRALARAAAGGELKVMLPMVTKPDELEEARRLLSAEVRALRSAGIDAAMPRLGMMVEVPAAALTIEAFDADFYSIGTNDLTQYVLAAARDSTAVAGLLDPLHPAVLELIGRVARAGERTGREVSVCGEMAARPECLRALLDAGIRVISVPPAAVASTKASVAALP